MYKYLSADIICSKMQTVFWEQSSRKTVNFEEQRMSKEKYLEIIWHKIEAIAFIVLQVFQNVCEKMFMNSLLYIAWDIFFWVFYGTTLMNKKIFPFFCNTQKTLSHLILN